MKVPMTETNITRDEQAQPASAQPEAARPDLLEKLTYHQHERDDLTLDEVLDVLATGWKKVPGRTERQMLLQLLSLMASSPQPTEAAAVLAEGAAPAGVVPDAGAVALYRVIDEIRSFADNQAGDLPDSLMAALDAFKTMPSAPLPDSHFESSLYVAKRMTDAGLRFQVRLDVGVESFSICRERAAEEDAEGLRRIFARALGRATPLPPVQALTLTDAERGQLREVLAAHQRSEYEGRGIDTEGMRLMDDSLFYSLLGYARAAIEAALKAKAVAPAGVESVTPDAGVSHD